MLDVPVAMLVHRRPEETRRVLDVVRTVRPRVLLAVADGPREPGDEEPCRRVRALFDTIDWPCRFLASFADAHLGCARRVATGLDWVFGQVERAIVLEDDVLPHPSFFPFCAELLDRYAGDERVMQIAGTNAAGGIASPYDYGFSKFVVPPWGWASWASAWRRYDFALDGWERSKPRVARRLGPTFRLWEELVDGYKRTLRSWDLQWNVAVWCHDGLSVVPSRNLVSNIGYGERATFTRFPGSGYSEMAVEACAPVLAHPERVDDGFDRRIEPAVMDFIREIMKQSPLRAAGRGAVGGR